MPTIAEHNRQAAAAYAAIPHEHWIDNWTTVAMCWSAR
jgi:hypothetical protein